MKRSSLLLFAFLLFFIGLFSVSAREWINAKGQKLNAEFIRFDGDSHVILERDRDGKEMRIAIWKFSAADRRYLKRLYDEESDIDEPDDADRDANDRPPAAAAKAPGKPPTSSDTKIIVIIVLIVANIPVYLIMGKGFFGDLEGFMESLRYVLTPNIISMFRGELMDDWWQSMKMNVFIVACGLAVFAEYWVIAKLFFNP